MNKTLHKTLLIFIASFVGWSGFGQGVLLKVANKQFSKQQYISAQQTYLMVLERNYRSAKVFRNLGDTYYYNGQFQDASKWYKELVESYPNQLDPEYLFRYVQSLKSIEDYEAADRYMEQFSNAKERDIRANLFRNQRDYLKRIGYQSGRYEIENVSINSRFSDFGTAFYGKYIVFSSSRDTLLMRQRTHKWTEESFLELYQSKFDSVTGELSEPSRFSEELNSKFHESTPVFTNDKNTVYFTRNNLDKKTIINNRTRINRLKIYRSSKTYEGKWSQPEGIPFNSDEYSVAHPALSADGKTLYFSSDMPGGYGKSDIYKVAIHENGTYGTPLNMGNKINTEGKETFPFITAENELYFSSNGHQGLGGLDIFISKLLQNGYHSDVINVGKPVNSPKDDFAYIIDNNTRIGYFSTNRDKTKGDDIYSLLELMKIKNFYPEVVLGYIKDKDTQKPISEARVALYNQDNVLIDEMITNEDGKYSFSLKNAEKTYSIKITKEGYRSSETVANLEEFSETYESDAELERTNNFILIVDPKHFNADNTEILPGSKKELDQVITLMRTHSNINVEIIAYLNKEKNDGLSSAKNRAKLIMQYFVDNGVLQSRMKYEAVHHNVVQIEEAFRLMMKVPPVQFHTNSGQIRPDANPGLARVLEIMEMYPNIKVEVQGHADSRGGKQINIKVSNKRAQSITNYLISQGISKDRLVAKGYGENNLRNHCADGIPCSDQEHQYNRRCEFMVIK